MNETNPNFGRKRVLSGMRPTGKLHLGNYMGALYNWVKLQQEYECYFFIADYHALTTDYADTSQLKQNIHQVALDFLAAGLDPERCTIFRQYHVPAHAELYALLANITPLSWLERVPSYKDQQEQLKEKDLATFGFLGYPLLQSADILVYQPTYVPVGQDQAAHVEITREIARRFNFLYPRAGDLAVEPRQTLPEHMHSPAVLHPILPEPQVLLTPSPKLPGTDGRKMSKSYGNTILLSDPEAEIRAKLKTMVTDPARVRRSDPGNPDVCPVFDLHKVFSTPQIQQEARSGCESAGIGCIECKSWVADAIVRELAPMRERRLHYEANPALVTEILQAGAVRANQRANQTMREVSAALGLD
jgi:tryptophanyl-tRNA synthetase